MDVCEDYRPLNAKTKANRYSIPNILDFNIRLADSKMFTTLHIRKSYHQIPVARNDIEKQLSSHQLDY